LYGDAFKTFTSRGLPLDVQLEIAEQNGFGMSVPDIFVDAIVEGWTIDRTFHFVRQGILDSGKGTEHVEKVMSALKAFVHSCPAPDSFGKEDLKKWSIESKIRIKDF